MLFHQYHPKTFTNATIDSHLFNIPDICKKTPRTLCLVEPTFFCGGRRLLAGAGGAGADDLEALKEDVAAQWSSFLPHY
jgi:hypothetical protein